MNPSVNSDKKSMLILGCTGDFLNTALKILTLDGLSGNGIYIN